MNNRSNDSLIKAFLVSNDGDRTADYVRHGRAHSTLSDHELESKWCSTVKDWADYPLDAKTREAFNDLRSEYTLRGKKPQNDIVQDDLRRLGAAAVDVIETMKKEDPQRYAEMEDRLVDDLAAFVEATGKRSN